MTGGAGVAHLHLRGDPYEVGRQHGAALAGPLRGFVDDSLCRLNLLLDEPVTTAGLEPVLSAFDKVITAELPRLAEEITGLADGIGIHRDQALLLQLRREILGYRKIPARGDCTTYAKAGSHPVLAQTVDLNGDLDDHISVLDVRLTGSPRRTLVLSFAGLLGYLGVNSDGLAVGLNLVLGGDWKPGVPPYLAIRHVLDSAATVDEAVECLSGLPLASSRSFMLCDAGKAVWVEALDGGFRCLEAQQAEHTNHFLHPDFEPFDEINVFARNSSRRRLEACRAGLAAMAPAAGVEEHFALLSVPPIRVAATGDIRYERTVAAAVALPGSGRLYIRPGDPATSVTREFTFADPDCRTAGIPRAGADDAG
ncbi:MULTISPECIES: C45 family peptidase [unclassified Streptomyces]|uniref:C45 family autoproteolytic acyltransferase/hydolase n=1 Tax=unclassified Streptomyces TaxID=2593676 RepID=UPI002259E12D|nr:MULTISPECIES: C45 family peptidase [unclassified Streptomyces]MCX4884161.1 C45 family peptidase [Streptomyces sp. NBC_00847]MCX5424279.1 C45 family peptidase [Streptomyces sp. NBC_00078]